MQRPVVSLHFILFLERPATNQRSKIAENDERTACAETSKRAVVVFGAISPNPIVSCVIVLKYGALKSSPKCTPGDV